VPSLDCDKTAYQSTLEIYNSLDFDTCVSGHNMIMGKEMINQIAQLL
jgi:hypothetical protein